MSKTIKQPDSIIFSPVNINARKSIRIRSGDTVRVHQKIKEKEKTRIQMFEGLVISVKHGKEIGSTFTVRKISSGVGVERIFPLYSPIIEDIEVIKQSKVRRSKLYYIRDKTTREARSKIKQVVTQKIQSILGFEKKEKEKVEQVGVVEKSTNTGKEDKKEAEIKIQENGVKEEVGKEKTETKDKAGDTKENKKTEKKQESVDIQEDKKEHDTKENKKEEVKSVKK